MEKIKSRKLMVYLFAIFLIISGISIALIFYILNPITEIYIKQLPDKISYYESEDFLSDGMTVYSRYKYYGIEKEIDDYKIIVDSPLNASTKKVEVVYEHNGTKNITSFDISVQPRIIDSIVILNYPTKTKYYEGEYFDVSGLRLQVNCKGEAKSFEPQNIIIDKQNAPLSVSDNQVIISYSENNITVYANIDIQVSQLTEQDQEIIEIKKLIDLLPSENNVGLEDENAVLYVQNLINNLSQEQKEQIDTSKIDKLNEKIAKLKKDREIALNKEYKITYKLKNIEAEIDFNNITTYKNADGIVTLNEPISNELYNLGYEFLDWENSDGTVVNNIQNINNDTTFYAVYKLSAIINLRFFNNEKELGVIEVNRFNGTDFYYNLINNEINNFIFEKTGEFPKYFLINGNIVNEVETKINREIQIDVQTQSPQDIIEDNIETPQNNSVMFVMGENVKEFILNEGYLTEDDLSDIYAIYNEQNNSYINYYVVSGTTKIYDDLTSINFGTEKSNIVVVTKNENVFNITLNYSGGKKIFLNLVGRQKIINALTEYANNDKSILLFINELSKIFDFEQILYKNIEFTLQERTNFEIKLHIDDEITTINIPNFSQEDYKLTNYLPSPKKLGYLFGGWSNEINGEIYNNEFLNIIIQNYNSNVDLYAVWQIDPNYKKPESQANYSQNFVGNWTATLEHNGVILSANLELKSDGVYTYKIFNNDIETVSVFGDYRFENNEIVIYFVENYGDYDYIAKGDLNFDLSFVDSNMLIATCFYVSKETTSVSIESFDIVLNKDTIKLENYFGNAILGTYQIEVMNILTNTLETYILELVNNGSAVITLNGINQNAHYRILNDKVILLSNGFIGIKDITEYILESNRV